MGLDHHQPGQERVVRRVPPERGATRTACGREDGTRTARTPRPRDQEVTVDPSAESGLGRYGQDLTGPGQDALDVDPLSEPTTCRVSSRSSSSSSPAGVAAVLVAVVTGPPIGRTEHGAQNASGYASKAGGSIGSLPIRTGRSGARPQAVAMSGAVVARAFASEDRVRPRRSRGGVG